VIIVRVPYRVSFFGGSSDYPEWLKEHKGAVLSTTVDKYLYVSLRKYPDLFGVKHRIVWSHIENATSCEEILHPVVRSALPLYGIEDGIELHYQGDLPSKSGMGSSSSFAVGMIHAIHAYKHEEVTKKHLAQEAIRLEQEILKEAVGYQDQVATAYGGLNVIRFSNGDFEVEPLEVDTTELQKRLMLFYLGAGRMSGTITKELVGNIPYRTNEIQTICDMVETGRGFLETSDWDGFGYLLGAMWNYKRRLSDNVSSPSLDKIYVKCIEAGALGGKLLGAGGTGFFLFYVPLEKQDAVREALSHLTLVPFRFESEGSKILFNG
jgi:D-glycero-alpha-D-manno-heptose-7-phosphate kinase